MRCRGTGWSRFPDRVGRAPLEKAVTDVIRGNLCLELFNRVNWHRPATRWQSVGIEAETIGDGNAVDGEPVVTGVLPGKADVPAAGAAGFESGERVAPYQVANVAVDAGDLRNLLGAKDGGRSLETELAFVSFDAVTTMWLPPPASIAERNLSNSWCKMTRLRTQWPVGTLVVLVARGASQTRMADSTNAPPAIRKTWIMPRVDA